MNRTKRLSAFLCLVFSFLQILSAQNVPKITWGEFKVEELQMKNWASDTSALAAVLGETGTINMAEVDGYYGFYLNIHRRIKIFKKEAFHYANQTIQVRTKDNRQFVREIQAQTIAPNGMKYLVDKKFIVYEKLSKDVTVIKFTFPNVTEGCILEYKYERQNKGGLFELQDWYFQEAIPIRFSVLNLELMSNYDPSSYQYILTLTIPEGYKVEELPKNLNLGLPPDDARFVYQISSDEKTIRLTVRIQINKTVYAAESYKFLKTFFAQISTKLEDMIVLKKKWPNE